MAQFSLANLRFILDTEDQADKPNAEELMQQLRENLEVLFMLLLDTGDSGSATTDPPNDATGVLTDTGAAYDADEHNGRTLLMASGTAKNTTYTIDDTTATTIVCTGDNLYAAGVRSGDTYKILYDVKVNTDGHNHDDVNSPALGDASISQAKLKTSEHSQSTTNTTWTLKCLSYAEYGFEVRVYGASFNVHFKRSDDTDYTNYAPGTWYGENVFIKTASGGGTAYAKYRYVTASGEVFWLWLLCDKATGEIISADAAPDHCSFGLDDPALRPHPFGPEYDPEEHDIVLINPDKKTLKAMYDRAEGRDILQTFLEDYEVDDAVDTVWPSTPVTVQILNADWYERWIKEKPVSVKKQAIPKVDYVLCKGCKLKAGKKL